MGGEDAAATGSLGFGATDGGADLVAGPSGVGVGNAGTTASLGVLSGAVVASVGGRTPVAGAKRRHFMRVEYSYARLHTRRHRHEHSWAEREVEARHAYFGGR